MLGRKHMLIYLVLLLLRSVFCMCKYNLHVYTKICTPVVVRWAGDGRIGSRMGLGETSCIFICFYHSWMQSQQGGCRHKCAITTTIIHTLRVGRWRKRGTWAGWQQSMIYNLPLDSWNRAGWWLGIVLLQLRHATAPGYLLFTRFFMEEFPCKNTPICMYLPTNQQMRIQGARIQRSTDEQLFLRVLHSLLLCESMSGFMFSYSFCMVYCR